MPTTALPTPVAAPATFFTSLQVVGSASSPIKVVEWGVGFTGATLVAGFPCDLIDTGTIAATVTAFAAVDVAGYDAIGQVVPQVGTTSGIPLVLSTSTSGYTSSAEGSITTTLQHDSVIVEPVGSFVKQFPQGREPYVKPGNVLRIRVKGDGVTTHYSWLVFET
jgi:hypothetical protein